MTTTIPEGKLLTKVNLILDRMGIDKIAERQIEVIRETVDLSPREMRLIIDKIRLQSRDRQQLLVVHLLEGETVEAVADFHGLDIDFVRAYKDRLDTVSTSKHPEHPKKKRTSDPADLADPLRGFHGNNNPNVPNVPVLNGNNNSDVLDVSMLNKNKTQVL